MVILAYASIVWNPILIRYWNWVSFTGVRVRMFPSKRFITKILMRFWWPQSPSALHCVLTFGEINSRRICILSPTSRLGSVVRSIESRVRGRPMLSWKVQRRATRLPLVFPIDVTQRREQRNGAIDSAIIV